MNENKVILYWLQIAREKNDTSEIERLTILARSKNISISDIYNHKKLYSTYHRDNCLETRT